MIDYTTCVHITIYRYFIFLGEFYVQNGVEFI